MIEKLTANRDRFPNAAVGDHVELRVRALVTKIETDVIDMTGYDARGEGGYMPGETQIDFLIERLVED